jgi:hypothetical protein
VRAPCSAGTDGCLRRPRDTCACAATSAPPSPASHAVANGTRALRASSTRRRRAARASSSSQPSRGPAPNARWPLRRTAAATTWCVRVCVHAPTPTTARVHRRGACARTRSACAACCWRPQRAQARASAACISARRRALHAVSGETT